MALNTEQLVKDRFDKSLYYGTTLRWPFCRKYESLDTRVTDTVTVVFKNPETNKEEMREVTRPVIISDQFSQKLRDEQTAKILKQLFVILALGSILTLVGIRLYKYYKKLE